MSTLRHALDGWRALPCNAMVRARFVARAAYSVLLEADKAFLAIDRAVVRAYLHRPRAELPTTRVDAFCAELTKTPMSALRERARAATLDGFARHRDEAMLTLTLPTGAGKTLLAARWALDERARSAAAVDTPTVILALPMLSIVDQTERVWRGLLGAADDDGETLLPFHSLSDRTYDSELPKGTADFFIDTWRSEVVVTTFDQLLLALYSDRAKHAMRYHRLLNARIVIDEVQCVPPILWRALSEGLRALTTLGSTRVLAMSATPSPCLESATEVLDDPGALYAGLARYELRLENDPPIDFEAFIARIESRCRDALSRGEGTLITVNVRATAQETFARLNSVGLDPLLLSGDMTPSHRLSVIALLKQNPVRVVVSTQCVEAGVDLDMHHVVRDLAPLDAIVQIAGRCNRHAHRTAPGTVTVLHLRDPKGRDNAAAIYDPVLLACTRDALAGREIVAEREVLPLCRSFFTRVAESKYQGDDDFMRWAAIKKALDVRALLRGGDDDQKAVLVLERDPSLKPALFAALRAADRWERRTLLRSLSARLARETVTVSAKVFAALATTPLGAAGVWDELLVGQYHPVYGIDSRRHL
jgi:CRISPR-associated endonuclease/helicase Cas3